MSYEYDILSGPVSVSLRERDVDNVHGSTRGADVAVFLTLNTCPQGEDTGFFYIDNRV